MTLIKPSHVMLMLGLVAPLCSNAADFCIATNGGFGNGGSSFIGKGFALPAGGAWLPWWGLTKNASSLIGLLDYILHARKINTTSNKANWRHDNIVYQ